MPCFKAFWRRSLNWFLSWITIKLNFKIDLSFVYKNCLNHATSASRFRLFWSKTTIDCLNWTYTDIIIPNFEQEVNSWFTVRVDTMRCLFATSLRAWPAISSNPRSHEIAGQVRNDDELGRNDDRLFSLMTTLKLTTLMGLAPQSLDPCAFLWDCGLSPQWRKQRDMPTPFAV